MTAVAKCPSCGEKAGVTTGQTMGMDRRPRWSRVTRCNYCRACVEEDALGVPPPDVRALLLESEGVWSVESTEAVDPLQALALVRQLFELDEAWILEARQQLPRLWTGTKKECLWIEEVLAEQGVEARVEELAPLVS